MGRTLRKALLFRLPGRRFSWSTIRKGVGLTLSVNNTRVTEGGPDNGSVAVFGAPARPGRVLRVTIGLAHPNSGSPSIGVATAAASLAASLGGDANSAGLVPQASSAAARFSAGGADLGSLGIGAVTTGDVVDMEIGAAANAGKLRFRNNGGTYSAWFPHGLSGTLYIGIGLRTAASDYVTAVWLS